MEKSKKIFCECKDCNHSGIINLDIKNFYKDIHNTIDKIKCSKCSSKNIDIFYDNVLVYSYSSRTECEICGNPIIEPRKNLTTSNMCCFCAQNEENNKTNIDLVSSNNTPKGYTIFKIDENTKRCPKCHSPLVRRRNNINNIEFYGCSNYPDCFYTETIKN